MRCAPGVVIAITIVATAIGCKNQSTPLTNPFLTPDRVPPPSTRVLTPGTAQPYYPGDAVPGSAASSVPLGGLPAATSFPPGGAFAPSTMPPATAYPGSPVTPSAPVSPPGGWGGYGPRAENSATGNLTAGDAVAIPNDQQQMRFASATLAATPSAAPVAANVGATQFRTPIQSLVPSSQDEAAAASAGQGFTPNAGTQFPIQQAAYDEAPATGAPGLRRLQTREVTPAEYIVPRAPLASSTASASMTASDGFRPQGSEPRNAVGADSSAAKGFRPPSIGGGQPNDANARFGVGPNQEWLRGQLEYWPTSGEWSVKYMGDGPVDQIGGRILIDNPQVLGHLPPGEFVVVEGQLFGRQIDDATYRPAYRVAVVQRQNK